MTCVECKSKIVVIDGCDVCSSCHNLQNELKFDDVSVSSDFVLSSDKTRLNKFIKMVDDYNFPYYVRITLYDIFPTIERYFLKQVERSNFISLQQLLIVLLERCGYSEFSEGIERLKTKSRVKKIENFVTDALHSNRSTVVSRLQDFELIEHVIGDCAVDSKHSVSLIYSDRFL